MKINNINKLIILINKIINNNKFNITIKILHYININTIKFHSTFEL